MSRARDVAYECVMAVTTDDAYANLIMPSLISRAKLDGRDAGFATELAYGALRMQGLYDAVIAKAARRQPQSLDTPVRAALWLGAHQALAMRVAPHAAVSETVHQVRREAGHGAAKFANAVMRRITEKTPDAWVTTVAPGTSRTATATRYSHPEWIVGELDAALVADGRAGQTSALLEAHNTAAHVSIVARPGLADRDELARTVDGFPGELSPWAVTLAGGRPADVPGMANGTVAVQDEGSQVVAGALAAASDIEAGERWLDMCAGPGGKAALLGALAAQHGARLDALELHPHREKLVRDSVRALPAGTVTTHVADATTWGEAGTYHRIMLDAPCSGLGALRRRPESRWRRTPQDVEDLTGLQRQLLSRGEQLLAPGGILAYITCSPVIAETREIIADTSLEVMDARIAVAAVTGTAADQWGSGPHVQMWSHAHGTDSMFIALLQRPA